MSHLYDYAQHQGKRTFTLEFKLIQNRNVLGRERPRCGQSVAENTTSDTELIWRLIVTR